MQKPNVLVERPATNGPAPGNGASPRNTIQPLTDSLIEAALAGGGTYTIEPDGTFTAVIPSSTIPASLYCSFLRGEHHIFSLSCQVLPPIPNRKRAEILRLCHEYHATQPFGRFFLRPTNAEETEYTLCFDAHLDACDGITLAFLKTFILSHLCGACGFLLQPAVLKLLSPTRPRKRSKRTNTKESSQHT